MTQHNVFQTSVCLLQILKKKKNYDFNVSYILNQCCPQKQKDSDCRAIYFPFA